MFWMYWKTKLKNLQGFFFGLFLVLIFGTRFFVEFVKENQVAFEDEMTLNMGQWLSIPAVAIGLWFMWQAHTKRKK
jgi:prolipoprotein diacylglyceryltransferase